MNYGYLIIYQKANGKLLYRATKMHPDYSKGQKTSMGWKILEVQRLYNGKCYSYNDFDTLLKRKRKISDTLTLLNNMDIKKIAKNIIEIGVLVYIFVKFSKM